MNDKSIILDFLEKNYYISGVGLDFLIIDKHDNEALTFGYFRDFLFKKIIEELSLTDNEKSSRDVLDKWFIDNKKRIRNKVVGYFDTLNLNTKYYDLLDIVLNYFINDKEIGGILLKDTFKKFYEEKVVKQKFQEFLAITSNNFTDEDKSEFLDYLNGADDIEEPKKINFNALLYEWFYDDKTEYKLNDLLSQLVVTLGSVNWIVTWIGHGELTEDKFNKYFTDENVFQKAWVKRKYEDWFENAVIEKTEKTWESDEFKRMFNKSFYNRL